MAMSGKRKANALHRLVVAAKVGSSAQRMAGFDPGQAVIDFGLQGFSSVAKLENRLSENEYSDADAAGGETIADTPAVVKDSLCASARDEMMARTRAAMVRAAALREASVSLRRCMAQGDVSMVESTLNAITAGMRFPLARSVLAGSGGGGSIDAGV